MKHTIYIVILFLLMALPLNAQTDRQYIREGNRFFHGKDYVQAETSYRKALGQNGESGVAAFNLGCALQAQKKDSLAIQQYKYASEVEKNPLRRASSYYNLGTVYHSKQDYENAIEAYKNALRLNPHHDDARYNLAVCMKQQNQQQNQQNQKNNDQNKDDKDKNKNKDKNDKQNQNQSKDNQNKQQNKNKDLSKDNAEQMLNAAKMAEQATQEKLKRAMQQPNNKNIEKNW